jgi:hypothetical protein
MSTSEQFLLKDSSSSDKSNREEMILDDDVKQTMVIVTKKNLQDKMEMKRRRRLVLGRVCTPQNRALGPTILMQDSFAEVPHNRHPSFVEGTKCAEIYF